ncbi:MarR family transcriptional regulator [Kitasatospora sp. GP82]|uniref:helix-turn-helix transcriptional regulator n=1 Tax=Kitasatospora sp. GP82 TaxID=3035089 RepID=UPI0024767EA1|nr:MarR family transcriptional regulator [Kitasatospora sp. GP82]MDH6130494.1 DNA-binding transcriptional ArsR family regulator [Kitasatospora sp. GP82]
MTSPAHTPSAAFWFNSMAFEYLPNAGLTPTERDVLDILLARQEPGGVVEITQAELSKRLGVLQPNISKALGRLSDLGIIDPPEIRRRGRVLLHRALAAYEGPRQAMAAMNDPTIPDWPLNIPTSPTRPARTSSPTSSASKTKAKTKPGPPKLRLV